MTDHNIKSTIHNRNKLFMSTYDNGDAAGMAELYTENAEFLPPNAETVKGKPAIKELFQSIMDSGVKSIKLITGEVEQHRDTAIEVSKAEFYGQGGQKLDDAKYIVIWKRENGEWKLHRDIFNSSTPAQ